MSQEFDPYRIWLGIPVEEQPANHYRLLGIELFESDPDVISNAADRQMTHVRTFQSGKYSSQSQKILNELSTARVTLLDKKRKSEYDAQLKQKLDAQKPVVAATVPVAPMPPVAPAIPMAPGVNQPAGPFGGVPGSLPGFNASGSPNIPGVSQSLPVQSPLPPAAPQTRLDAPPPVGGFNASSVNQAGPRINPTPAGRRPGKPAKKEQDNSLIIYAGGGIGLAVILLFLFLLAGNKSDSETATAENNLGNNDQDNLDAPSDWNQRFMPAIEENTSNNTSQTGSKKTKEPEKESDKESDDSRNNTGPITAEELAQIQAEAEKNGGSSQNSGSNSDSAMEDSDIDALLAKTGQGKRFSQVAIPVIADTLQTKRGPGIMTPNGTPVQNLIFNADATQFIVAQKNQVINIYDLVSGQELDTLTSSELGIPGGIQAIPSGIIYAFYNPLPSEVQAFQKTIASPAFASDPDREDIRPISKVVSWNPMETGFDGKDRSAAVLKGYYINGISATVDKDNNELVAIAATDGLVHIFNPASGNDYLKFSAADTPVPQPQFPAGTSKEVISAKKDFLKVVSPETVPTCVLYSPDGKLLAGGNSAGIVYIWNPEVFDQTTNSVESSVMLKVIVRKQLSNSPVLGLAFSKEDQKLFAYCEDGSVAQWDWMSNKEKPVFSGSIQESLQYAALAANDKYLITQTTKGTIQIWTWNSDRLIMLVEMNDPMSVLAAHPEKPFFLAANSTGELAWYNIPENTAQLAQKADFTNIYSLPIYEPVPAEDQWQAKSEDAKKQVAKKLGQGSDAQKAAEVASMLKKMPELKKLDPATRYALYRELLSAATVLRNPRLIQTVVAETIKFFEDDPETLCCGAYIEMLDSGIKGQELTTCMEKLLTIGEKASVDGKIEIVEQVTKAVGPKSLRADDSIRRRLRDLREGKVQASDVDVQDEGLALADPASEDAPAAQEALSDSLYSLGILNSRERGSREQLQASFGDTSAMRTALNKTLNWLSDRQSPDGAWSFMYAVSKGKNKDVLDQGIAERKYAASAMAVLTFLGAGESPVKGDYARNLKLGIKFLTSYDPTIPEAGTNLATRPLVIQALLEAQDGKVNPMILGRLLEATLQTVNTDGGWGAEYKKQSDIWSTFWNVQALYIAQQLDSKLFKAEHKQALTRSREYFASCFDTKTGQPEAILLAGGGVVMSGGKLTDDQLKAVSDAINSNRISNDDFMTRYAKVRVMALLGMQQEWKTFIKESVPTIISEQKSADPEMGSWNAKTVTTGYNQRFSECGRFGSTILNALILENSYRYAPVKKN